MRFPVVYVEWLDSSHKPEWHTLSETQHPSDKCVSVGFLVDETDDWITFIQSCTNREKDANDQADASMTIPKVAITKRILLTGADE